MSKFCDPMDCSTPQAPLSMGILQESPRILEWVVMPSSSRSSKLETTQVPSIAGKFFTIWATREAFSGVLYFLAVFLSFFLFFFFESFPIDSLNMQVIYNPQNFNGQRIWLFYSEFVWFRCQIVWIKILCHLGQLLNFSGTQFSHL